MGRLCIDATSSNTRSRRCFAWRKRCRGAAPGGSVETPASESPRTLIPQNRHSQHFAGAKSRETASLNNPMGSDTAKARINLKRNGEFACFSSW